MKLTPGSGLCDFDRSTRDDIPKKLVTAVTVETFGHPLPKIPDNIVEVALEILLGIWVIGQDTLGKINEE